MKPLKLKRSQAQEKRVAKANGGRVQAQSGAGPFHKEDVRLDKWLIQNKGTTSHKQITLSLEALRVNEQNAALDGRLPALQFDLGDHLYWVMPAWVVAQELDLYA